MIYQEYQPNQSLLPYIETYWTASGCSEQDEKHKILPDGCVDIIFSLTDNTQFGLEPYVPNLIGAMTTYSEGSYTNIVDMVGIRFKPAGITAFTKLPINQVSDCRLNCNLIETIFDEQFYACLPEKTSAKERIAHIDLYLTQKLRQAFVLKQQIVFSVVLIQNTKGQLSLKQVADEVCLSLRHFEREFKFTVGISPKKFSRIVKFKHTLTYLKTQREKSLFDIALDCGYFDKAHLIKDFKTLSGNSPSYFRKV